MTLSANIDTATTNFPLFLSIVQEGVGGVEGQAPTVALRDGATVDSYLDFNDNTFKTSGWVLQHAPLTEVGGGHYQRALNVNALNRPANTVLVAEYSVDNGAIVGVAADLLILVEIHGSLSFVRKSITNRMETLAGTPGRLVLYDDNGTSVLMEWELRDDSGGGILTTSGVPTKRGAGS